MSTESRIISISIWAAGLVLSILLLIVLWDVKADRVYLSLIIPVAVGFLVHHILTMIFVGEDLTEDAESDTITA